MTRSHRHADALRQDTAPPERAQHDRIAEGETMIAGVKRQRVVHPLEMLAKGRSALSDPGRQYDAAMAWLADYEVGVEGAREAGDDLPAGVRSGSRELLTQRQIEAAARYRRGLQAMGKHTAWAAVQVVLERRTLSDLAARAHSDKRRVVAVLDVALLTLADHYGC